MLSADQKPPPVGVGDAQWSTDFVSCPGLRGLSGHRVFSAKSRVVLGKPGCWVTPVDVSESFASRWVQLCGATQASDLPMGPGLILPRLLPSPALPHSPLFSSGFPLAHHQGHPVPTTRSASQKPQLRCRQDQGQKETLSGGSCRAWAGVNKGGD